MCFEWAPLLPVGPVMTPAEVPDALQQILAAGCARQRCIAPKHAMRPLHLWQACPSMDSQLIARWMCDVPGGGGLVLALHQARQRVNIGLPAMLYSLWHALTRNKRSLWC